MSNGYYFQGNEEDREANIMKRMNTIVRVHQEKVEQNVVTWGKPIKEGPKVVLKDEFRPSLNTNNPKLQTGKNKHILNSLASISPKKQCTQNASGTHLGENVLFDNEISKEIHPQMQQSPCVGLRLSGPPEAPWIEFGLPNSSSSWIPESNNKANSPFKNCEN
ncbi:hypothetical protein ACFE04_010753 [Oxalis oulophora]